MQNKNLMSVNPANVFVELAHVRSQLDALTWLLTKDLTDSLSDDFQDVQLHSYLQHSLNIYELHAVNPEVNQQDEVALRLKEALAGLESKMKAKGLLKEDL